MKNFKGYGENIIVKVEKKKEEKKTASGIIIPGSEKKEKYFTGTVISLDTNYFISSEDVKLKDVVVFGLYDGLLLEETEDYAIYSILENSIKALYV